MLALGDRRPASNVERFTCASVLEQRVSPERAVRFARILGHSEVYFVQLALQDMVDEAGVDAKVEVKVA